MKRALVVLLAACGPSVGVGDDGSMGDATTTSSQTSAVSLTASTSATTATTQPTTMSTTAMEEGSTSIDPTTIGDDDAHDTGVLYIGSPDGGGSIECDIWAQDCGRGKKCMPWSNVGGDAWNASRCSPIHPAPAGIGEPCHVEDSPYSGVDDCAPATMCWDVDPITLVGTCISFCSVSEANPTCADGTSCWIEFEGTILVCLPACDPLAPECGDGEVCVGRQYGYTIPMSFGCLPTPQFQPQPYGQGCQYFEVCGDGLFCVDSEHVPGCTDSACCTVIGESAAPPVCPDATQTCIPFDDAMPSDGLCYCGVEA